MVLEIVKVALTQFDVVAKDVVLLAKSDFPTPGEMAAVLVLTLSPAQVINTVPVTIGKLVVAAMEYVLAFGKVHTTVAVPLHTQLVPVNVLVASTPVGKVSVSVKGEEISTLANASVAWVAANT